MNEQIYTYWYLRKKKKNMNELSCERANYVHPFYPELQGKAIPMFASH